MKTAYQMKNVYRLGTCLIHNISNQVYVITNIDSKSNHKGAWTVYTLRNVITRDAYCLRAGKLRRKFKKSKTAQVLYGDKVYENTIKQT